MSYDIPESVNELFANGERSYSIVDYDKDPMDNIQSMTFFLDEIGVSSEDIALADGTQVLLKHKDYPYQMQVDTGGLGDCYSHSFEVSIYKG